MNPELRSPADLISFVLLLASGFALFRKFWLASEIGTSPEIADSDLEAEAEPPALTRLLVKVSQWHPTLQLRNCFRHLKLESRFLLIPTFSSIAFLILTQHVKSLNPDSVSSNLALALGVLALLSSTAAYLTSERDVDKKSGKHLLRTRSFARASFILIGIGASFAARAGAGDSMRAISGLHSWLWLFGIGFTLAGLWNGRGLNNIRLKGIDWTFLILVTSVSFWARGSALESIPPILGGNEAEVGLTGTSFTLGERDNLLSLAWYSFPSLYFWIVSRFQLIGGQTIEAIRLPSALAGTLTVPVVFLAGRLMWNRWVGAFASGYLALSHFHIHFSRLALNNIFDPLLLVILITALWYDYKANSQLGFVIAGLALGFSQFFYVTARALPLLVIIWLIFLNKVTPVSDRAAGLLRMTLTAFVVSLALTLLFLSRPEEYLARLVHVSLARSQTPMQLLQLTLLPGIQQLPDSILGFFWYDLQGIFYSPGQPLLLPIPAALLLIGLLVALRRAGDPRNAVLLIALAVSIMATAFSVGAPSSQRMIIAAVPISLLIGLGVDFAQVRIASWYPDCHRQVLLLSIALVAVASIYELGFYLFEAVPSRAYWDRLSATSLSIAEAVKEMPPGTAAYFVGTDFHSSYRSSESLSYLTPNLNWQDLDTDGVRMSFPNLSPPGLVIVILEGADLEAGSIAQHYLDTTAHVFLDEATYAIFTLLHVQPVY